jgi:hypothetical protein
VDHRLAFRPLEIDRQAPFVAIEGGEEAGAEPAETARVIAFRRWLDLDHISAELGKDKPSSRSHDRVAKL